MRPKYQAPVVPGTKNIYLSNKELLKEVKAAKRKGEMSNQLARMLQMLCGRYAKKGNFINYTYNEDMQAYAMMMLVRTWNAFDPEKSNNPFAFFTQCIKHSFIQYLNQEKRQRNIRDLLLVDQGMNPSYNYTDGMTRPGGGGDDEEDYDAQRIAAIALKKAAENPAVGGVIDSVPNTPEVDTPEESKYNDSLLKY